MDILKRKINGEKDIMTHNIMNMIGIFLRGLLMGICDIMPGVSGGTIALITGIYEELINSISKIKFGFLKPLIKLNFEKFKIDLLEEVNFLFFIPLGLGIIIAMLCMSNLMVYCLNVYPAYTYAFFGGLILSSIYIVYTELNALNLKTIAITIISAIIIYLFVGLNPIQANHELITLFFSGLIAICAMILPGISGAFLLLLLGQYEFMINALHTLALPEIIVFVIGAAVGIMSISRIIKYLLKNYKEATMAVLIGLMIGSLRIPATQVITGVTGAQSVILCIIIAIIGCILIIIMEKKFNYINY